MTKSHKVEQGNKRRQEQVDHTYTGKFSDQQTNGNTHYGKKYGAIEHDSLNSLQSFLYNRALFGLSVYSQEEIKEMRWDKRQRIIKVHKRAQSVLNIWKQQIVNSLATELFKKFFPDSRFTKEITEMENDTDLKYINRMPFKSLHITKPQIISKLVAEKVLPVNFYELKPE